MTAPPPGTESGLLRLAQILSPAFPVGGFAYSHGMEWVIREGDIHDAESLAAWLAEVLEHGAGRNDAILIAATLALPDDADDAAFDTLGDLARALAASPERDGESMAMGAALGATLAGMRAAGEMPEEHMPAPPPLPWPVALGRAARGLGLPPRLVCALALQAFASNLVTIAVRFVPLGQTEGQRVLAGLAPLIQRLAEEAAQADPGGLGGAAFRGDLAAQLHETMQPRIFRT
ncbi:MAG: urease accessory protein UreF [Rhodobacteraceae bacterium]|nr:urease accessory protein UreF [Paracoccaceae bacterium]